MFCALETYNGTQKYVPQLIVTEEDGTERVIDNQKEVEHEISDFYKDLYSCKDSSIEINSIEEFLGPDNTENIPKVKETEKAAMEGKLNLDEMTKYLKKTKNNVAPGSSGFTNEFYKFFWRDLKVFVINSVDYAFENNRLSVSQNLGIISIIPKGDKDKRFLTNWRPLTLLNSLYKLISGCIAERIKPVLKSLVHPDQKGFVAGRYIGECIRTTFDIMQYAKENNMAGLLLLIDFEKAYDSISFKFITKVLKFFNFGQDLIKWVEILLHDFSAVINHCGNISQSFEIARGCRQGDPIASYLFILCIEVLAHKMRFSTNILGLKLGQCYHLMEIYADDLTIFLDPNDNNLRNVIKVLTDFYKLSGLKISVTKTKAVWIGSKHDSNEKLCNDLNLKWVKSFTLLGINFDSALVNMKNNFSDKIDNVEKMLSNWSYRYLTPFGKVTVVKSLGLSKLSHVALVIPNPTKDMIKRVDSIFYKFIWGKGSEKVRREDAKLPVKEGGLGMPDIQNFWTAFKFSWMRRLMVTEAFWPKLVLQEISQVINKTLLPCELLQLGASKLNEISKSLKNPFWKQVLASTVPMVEGSAFCNPEKLTASPFWYNPLITRNRVVKYNEFPEISDKIETVADFLYVGTNNIMQYNDFIVRYNCNITEIKYIDIRYTIMRALQKLKLPQFKLSFAQYPLRPILIDIAMSTTKGCSTYCKFLSKKASLNSKMNVREAKWHDELGTTYSIYFWDKVRLLCSKIDFDNQLKWLQFQIIRNSLQTNYIVNHFKPNVLKHCSYCKNPNFDELVSHLFWFCPYVSQFLRDIVAFIDTSDIDFNPTKEQFLFGNDKFQPYSPQNFICLVLKKYIWRTKFKTTTLTLVGFKPQLKNYLCDLKYMFQYKNHANQFDEWNTLFEML